MIQDEGIVSTGAGMHSPHSLQVMAKSQNRAGDPMNMDPSIGEEKAKCLESSRNAQTADPWLSLSLYCARLV